MNSKIKRMRFERNLKTAAGPNKDKDTKLNSTNSAKKLDQPAKNKTKKK